MIELFDTHCHLDADAFDADRDAVIARALEAGVTRFTTVGCVKNAEELGVALDLARAHPGRMVATVGVHPHDAKHLDDDLIAALEAMSREPLVVAVGETGLDFHYDFSPRDVQAEAFRRQVALARALRKPIVVHTRNAPDDTLRILREESARDVGGIIHCFSEGPEFAASALDLGFVASFSGIVTFKNAAAIREAARLQPADALLVETDAPYLAPVPHRGKRNEPAYVRHTATAIAELRGESLEDVAARSTENARRVFRMG